MKNSSPISARKNSLRLTFIFSAIVMALILAVLLPSKAQTTSRSAAKVFSGKSQTVLRTPISAEAAAARAGSAKVPVMVELVGDAAAIPYAQALKVAQAQANVQTANAVARAKTSAQANQVLRQQNAKPVKLSSAAIQQIKTVVRNLDQAQRQMLPALTGGNVGGQVIYRVQKAYNGIAMMVSQDKIVSIAALPGVKAVHRMTPKYPTALSDIDFLGTRAFWDKAVPAPSPNGLNIHGEGIRVADIDTGLDYIHVDFGGPGSSGYSQVANHTTAPNQYFPSAKVPGGYDFAGDAYTGSNTPQPDPDPFDGAGHGTGTASLIGGYGVSSNGYGYFGPWDATTPIGSLNISPGFAPNCLLYPIRVFGNTGSTNLVTEAIDWAMDPNQDGSFSDHMDVINMSLGAPDGFADDPDQVSASNAAAIGIIVCSAAGNDGDSYYDVSGPSVATGTLSIAASYNDQAGFVAVASVTANSPAAISGQKYGATIGSASPPLTSPITGTLVYAVPHIANTPLTNAAQVNGNICLIDRGSVSFTSKIQQAYNAGAIAVIIVNNAAGAPANMNTSGQPPIPAISITQMDGNTIKSAANFDGTTGMAQAAGGCNVTLKSDNFAEALPGAAPDTIPSYTSRGPRSGDNALKPDVTAPAESVGVAAFGTGNKLESFNGTSSATPHVAGAMALLRQLHQSWSVQELNALICNTANHDLFTTSPGPSPSPTPSVQYGAGRIGAGRIDLAAASKASVIAYNANDNSASVSFGSVEVPADSGTSLTKNVLVVNKGAANVTYNVTYQDVTPVGGVDFNVPSTLTVNAGTSATVPIELDADGTVLRHVRETSVSNIRVYSTLGLVLDRQWLTEKTGYLVLTPTAGTEPTIRVALYAAPKPVSSMHATSSNTVPTGATGSFNIKVSGAQIHTGTNLGAGFDIISLVKPLELQYASASVGSPSAPTDPNVIKYVGVTSDYATYVNNAGDVTLTTITFAIDGFGDYTVPAGYDLGDRRIQIDANQDGVDDFTILLDSFGNAVLPPAQGNIDNVYFPVVLDLATPSNSATSNYFTNGIDPAQLDTNIFNNSATLISVDAAQLSMVGKAPYSYGTAFNYRVETYDRNGHLVDTTPELTYDLANPGFDVTQGNYEPSVYPDLSGAGLQANYNGANVRNNGSIGVLLIHLHNGVGNRSDAIAFRKPTIKSFSPSHGPAGTLVTITGTNFNSSTGVTFNNKPASAINVLSSTTLVATVPSTATTGRIRVSNAAGTSTSTSNFSIP